MRESSISCPSWERSPLPRQAPHLESTTDLIPGVTTHPPTNQAGSVLSFTPSPRGTVLLSEPNQWLIPTGWNFREGGEERWQKGQGLLVTGLLGPPETTRRQAGGPGTGKGLFLETAPVGLPVLSRETRLRERARSLLRSPNSSSVRHSKGQPRLSGYFTGPGRRWE